MSKIVVLFNLKDGVSVAEYEAWAQETDLPLVNNLPGVERFEVFRTTGLLGADDAAPYNFIEILDISDMEKFQVALGDEVMQRVASEFQGFADSPLFITTESLR